MQKYDDRRTQSKLQEDVVSAPSGRTMKTYKKHVNPEKKEGPKKVKNTEL